MHVQNGAATTVFYLFQNNPFLDDEADEDDDCDDDYDDVPPTRAVCAEINDMDEDDDDLFQDTDQLHLQLDQSDDDKEDKDEVDDREDKDDDDHDAGEHIIFLFPKLQYIL